MKLVRLSAENFKNLRVIDVKPNADITKISGGNGAGKTSVLDAIFYGLAGRKTTPKQLLRQGEKKGMIRLELDGYTITRQLDEKGGNLVIETANKTLIKNPQEWLEGIAGKIGFDPLAFMRKSPNDQFEVLRELVTLEANIDDLETRNDNDAETITRIKKEANRMEAQRDGLAVIADLPDEPYNIEQMMEQSRADHEHNREIERQSRQRDERKGHRVKLAQDVEENREKIADLRQQLDDLESETEQWETALKTADDEIAAWEPLPSPKDFTELDTKISESSRINAAVSANNERKRQREKLEVEIDEIRKQISTLGDAIRERTLTIARAVKNAKFPIEGLSFETREESSGGREVKIPKKTVTYKGVPLNDASSADQIRVSVAIGMATSPDVKTLLIREGSLLDEKSMAILKQMAKENDYQYILEVVDTSGKVGIYLEDGQVKAVNPEVDDETPAPAAKPTKKGKTKATAQGELLN